MGKSGVNAPAFTRSIGSCYNGSMQFEGITLAAVIPELERVIKAGTVQQIYQVRPDLLSFHIYKRGRHQLLIAAGPHARIHLSQRAYGNPRTPPPFCMLLRKHLAGSKLLAIQQPGLERILDLTLGRNGKERTLRAELLAPQGNVILLRENEILGAMSPSSGTREMKPHGIYRPPPSQRKLDPRCLGEGMLAGELADQGDATLKKALFGVVDGIGPRTAGELIRRAGLDAGSTASQLGPGEVSRLETVVRAFFSSLSSGQLRPRVYFRGGEAVDCTPLPYESYAGLDADPRETMSEALDACVPDPHHEGFKQRYDDLSRILSEEVGKVERALEHVDEDLEKAKRYEVYKERGDLLMAHLAELRKGQAEVELRDFEGTHRVIPLNPSLEPAENAERCYERYKKLKRGVGKLRDRSRELQWELGYLRQLQVHLEQAETLDELRELEDELGAEGYLPAAGGASGPSSSGPRRYAFQGYLILVGRNGRQNDALIREAHPEDLWLHAKDRPGAHVIVKGDRKNAEEIPDGVLTRAAELAAYYSNGRSSTKVRVSYTPVKSLKKPKGAKPGLVVLTREAGTLLVAPRGEHAHS